MGYNDDQIATLVTVNIVVSTFSFLGALFIIANFFGFEDFKKNYAFKFILFVAIGDIINSVGNFMGSPSDGSPLCYIQGFTIQFGDIFSFAWVTAIAWVIFNVIRREAPPTEGEPMKWYKKIHLIIWPTTLVLSVLPATTNNYGDDNGICWITHSPKPTGEIWRVICFFIPLWGAFVYVGSRYYQIWGQLTAPDITRKNSTGNDPPIPETQNPETKKHNNQVSGSGMEELGAYQISTTDTLAAAQQQSSDDNNQVPKSGGGTLQRIKYYPLVLFGCYFFATVRRLWEWAADGEDPPYILALLEVSTSASLGTWNAILYGFTPMVRKKDSEWIRSKLFGENRFVLDSGDAEDGGNDEVALGDDIR